MFGVKRMENKTSKFVFFARFHDWVLKNDEKFFFWNGNSCGTTLVTLQQNPLHWWLMNSIELSVSQYFKMSDDVREFLRFIVSCSPSPKEHFSLFFCCLSPFGKCWKFIDPHLDCKVLACWHIGKRLRDGRWQRYHWQITYLFWFAVKIRRVFRALRIPLTILFYISINTNCFSLFVSFQFPVE